MNNVSGNFFVEMLVDGDSAQGNIRSTKPLVQMYNPTTGGCIPDWSSVSNQPIIYPVMRSGNENTIKPVIAGSETWFYNNTKITFNDSGIASAPDNVIGKLQKVTYNNGTVDVPALRIIANLASASNMDADTITMSGKIEASGHALSFYVDIPLAISEYSDSAYSGFIHASNGGIIDEGSEIVELTQALYKGGDLVPQGYYSVAWYKDGSNVPFSTASSAQLSQADIDGKHVIYCKFLVDTEVVANYAQEVSDETDPYFIDVTWSGRTKLATGETLAGQCKVKKVGTGETQTGFSFEVTMTDTAGNAFAPASAPTADGLIYLTYADAQRAGGNITGYIIATK